MKRARQARKQPRTADSSTPKKSHPSAGPSKKKTSKASGAKNSAATGAAKKSSKKAGSGKGQANSSRSGSAKGGASSRKRTGAGRRGKGARRPLVNPESKVLLHLEDLLKQRIVGKDDAITRVADAIRIRRTNLDFRPQRPDGSFLLVGPPGVGKSEFAHAVADVLMGSENQVLHLDMADFTEDEDVEDLLVTAYPGTEGVLVEGALTTPLRKNPRAVILFHGIERSNPTIMRLLLHVLERGTLADAQGEISFNEAIIFATTTLHYDEAEMIQQIGFARTTTPREVRARKVLEEQFGPELIGAFNEVLFFNTLTPEDVRLIARYKVGTVLERLKKQKRGVIISDRVWDTFIWEEEVKKAGARYLNRALEERLFTPLSKYLLQHGDARSIMVDVQDRQLVIKHQQE